MEHYNHLCSLAWDDSPVSAVVLADDPAIKSSFYRRRQRRAYVGHWVKDAKLSGDAPNTEEKFRSLTMIRSQQFFRSATQIPPCYGYVKGNNVFIEYLRV